MTVTKRDHHETLARETVGGSNGPGSEFHTVDVLVSQSRTTDRVRVQVVETWGSDQGYLEEHGRREVVARGDDLDSAVELALDRSREAGAIDDENRESVAGAAGSPPEYADGRETGHGGQG
jgi:hypothetical protein